MHRHRARRTHSRAGRIRDSGPERGQWLAITDVYVDAKQAVHLVIFKRQGPECSILSGSWRLLNFKPPHLFQLSWQFGVPSANSQFGSAGSPLVKATIS